MSLKNLLAAGLLISFSLVNASPTMGLSLREISEIAQEITVKIEGNGEGSGIIIDKQGNTYTVLTNCHVIETSGKYIIQVSSSPFTFNSLFVVKASKANNCLPNVDLAILKFTSRDQFGIAKLGDFSELKPKSSLYVAGWAGEGQYISGRRYRLNSGVLLRLVLKATDGYSLVHNADTAPGMSGGPILDENGLLVGINGRFLNTRNKEFLGIPINILIENRRAR